MSEAAESKRIAKAEGVTRAERYLHWLCERTFLSLWSYPGICRDQGRAGASGDGKEVCDLLVVFGDHVLIFSDKDCKFPDSPDEVLNWQRWFRRAIERSSKQVWGAERWIRNRSGRLYIDRRCTQPLPLDLPPPERARFHLIVVAHGVSQRVRQTFPGSSGSLMVNSMLQGMAAHVDPFTVGDLDPTQTFVHVFDEDALNTLMSARDTIADFVAYLEKREVLLRNEPKIYSTGEEQLLAVYLKKMNDKNEHDFVFPLSPGQAPTQIGLTEGHWEEFCKNPQRKAQIAADEISYTWDRLIERFSHYALRGEQYHVTDGGFKDSELVLRFMAREPRYKRRALAQAIVDMIRTTPSNGRRLRVMPPVLAGDPYYVLLLFPFIREFIPSEVEYREARLAYLRACCSVVKLQFPDALDIVGIATDTGTSTDGRSEDAVYMDARHWTEAMTADARLLQRKLEILVKPTKVRFQAREYPRRGGATALKIGRNQLCPCGSGKKYKRCHGR